MAPGFFEIARVLVHFDHVSSDNNCSRYLASAWRKRVALRLAILHNSFTPPMDSITVGGRAILLPSPEESCMRCDEAGKLIVRWSFRRRVIAFFMPNQEPVGKRYYYVQCMRFSGHMNQTLATFAKIKALVGRRYNARTTLYDQTPDSLCYMNQLKDLIFSECMMLVTGRILYLYAMCHEDNSGGTLWAPTCMKNWRDAILKANESSAQQ
jgi:hypothetical protein